MHFMIATMYTFACLLLLVAAAAALNVPAAPQLLVEFNVPSEAQGNSGLYVLRVISGASLCLSPSISSLHRRTPLLCICVSLELH